MLQEAVARASEDHARVLLIDDDEIVAGALFHQLHSIGIAADVAVDAIFGEQLLRTYAYSLVVVDPYLTGNLHAAANALLDHVRAIQPAARVIVLSAYGTRFSDRLVNDPKLMVVGKPQSVLSLTSMIGHLVRSHEAVEI